MATPFPVGSPGREKAGTGVDYLSQSWSEAFSYAFDDGPGAWRLEGRTMPFRRRGQRPHHEVDQLRGVGQGHRCGGHANLAVPVAEHDCARVRMPGCSQVHIAAPHVGEKHSVGGRLGHLLSMHPQGVGRQGRGDGGPISGGPPTLSLALGRRQAPFTASGESVTVNETRGSMGPEPGDFMLARLAQLGDVSQIRGAVVPVPLRLRTSALELVDLVPDVTDLATWYGMAVAPPRLVNQAGEPIVFCQVELAGAGEASVVVPVLNGILESTKYGEWVQWWDYLGDGDRVVGGVVRTEGETVIVEAYSKERCALLVELVRGVLPDAQVVSETNTEVEPRWSGRGPAGASAGTSDPAVQGLLEQIMRQKEEEWVEESIPALGGLTPRQALEDPTRKEDLLALLRGFEKYGAVEGDAGSDRAGGGFNVQRLRMLLGIDEG
jgi:hypothetical protein